MDNAILMASGMGTRMRPLTYTVPKPLISVENTPMIETVINGLKRRGVRKIVIVVGYLAEQFSYLREKYPNVEIIRNTAYKTVNNISSVFFARELLLQGNCFICEADLFVSDSSIFTRKLEHSCYYGRMVEGFSEDWVFERNGNGRIIRIGKRGRDCYNMTGIAYFLAEDARKLHDVIEKEYGKEGYEALFWDDAVNRNISEFNLTVEPVESGQIVEIDTVEELEAVRKRVRIRGNEG